MGDILNFAPRARTIASNGAASSEYDRWYFRHAGVGKAQTEAEIIPMLRRDAIGLAEAMEIASDLNQLPCDCS